MRKWFFHAAILFGVFIVVQYAAGLYLSAHARDRLVELLRERYQGKVELGRVTISLFPRPVAIGEELHIWPKDKTDLLPLISIRRFTFRAGLGLFQTPKHIRELRLEGFEIHVPPRKEKNGEEAIQDRRPETRAEQYPFVVDQIIADGAVLYILPKSRSPQPLEFDIRKLTVHFAGIDKSLKFHAVLTNAKPPGEIQSEGEFGPWHFGEPGDTPLSGEYVFRDANLSVFKGIAGTLSSEGRYHGVLGQINVEGSTDTPDFMVRVSGNPVHLKTDFRAIVDGTNGDTRLRPVVARFGQSTITAYGGVVGRPGVEGKTVTLNINVKEAKLEDLLRLAVRGRETPMKGAISFDTGFELPPGDIDVIDKLRLRGTFSIDSALFTNIHIQQELNSLSGSARGDPESGSDNVASNFRGHLVLNDGVVTFPRLTFDLPGANVELAGKYELRGEQVELRGDMRMEAKLSEATSGVKSVLLKIVDPFFKKGKQTVLPIKITGTLEHPSFGLNLLGKK